MREVGERGLQEQDGPEDVDGVGAMKVVERDVGEGAVHGDAGVVDQDVDLEFPGFGVREVVLGGAYDVGGAGGGADVGLDGDGCDGVGLREGGGELCGFGAGGVGGVV